MKLIAATLLVLGLSHFCAAEQLTVELKPADENHDFSYICMDMPCSGYTCVEVQAYQPDTPFIYGQNCALFTPISTAETRNTLDYLRSPNKAQADECVLLDSTENSDIYVCGEDDSTTTTTTTTTTGTTTTTAAATATVTVPTCSNMDTIFGKKKGNGFNGDCCKTEADCKDSCIKGKCNGPKRATTSVKSTTSTKKDATTTTGTTTTTTTKKATTTTTTTTKKATQTPSVCKAGYRGKKNGRGPKGACCSTQRDCKESCIKGSCN